MIRGVLVLLLSMVSAMASASKSTTRWSQLQQTKKSWMLSASYQGRGNLAETESEKTIEHGLFLDWGYYSGPWSLSLGSGMGYYSIGGDIPKEPGNPWTEDISASLGYSTKVLEDSRISFSLLASLPTSSSALYEQYAGIYRTRLGLSTRVFSRLVVTNQIQLGYVANTYYYSPVTNQVNPDWAADYSLGLVADLSRAWYLRMSVAVKGERTLDGAQTAKSQQSATLGFAHGGWNGSVSYINGSYFDEGPARFWAFDQFRQLVMAGIGYDF